MLGNAIAAETIDPRPLIKGIRLLGMGTLYLPSNTKRLFMMRMPMVVAIIAPIFLSISANAFLAHSQESAPKKGSDPKQVVKKEPARMWEHRGAVLTMAFTREGDRLVTGGAARGESVVV